jgi:hypothetical protein
MSESPLPQRVVVCHAAPEAFAPVSRPILARLGYRIVPVEEFEAFAEATGLERADLRIVDERRLPEVVEDGEPSVPIVVLTGRHGVTGADARIAGALRRPAGLHELYRLMQQILEDKPRAVPRIPTHLPALAQRAGREWSVAVLSLSENGCLIRSSEPLTLGTRLSLHLQLPRSGPLVFDAETAYQLVPDVRLVFHATTPAHRAAIADYLHASLLPA